MLFTKTFSATLNLAGLFKVAQRNLSGFAIAMIATATLLLTSCDDHPEADLIVYNATIYTVDTAFNKVEAMAIKDGKIIETGTLDHIRRTYRAPKNIDLEGKFVYPGFNDAHSHFMGYAGTLRSVNLVGTQSFDEVIERIKTFQNEHKAEFITGRGWDQNDWSNKEFPTRERLDILYPETPVFVQRIDGHAALANGAALRYAGIDSTTKVNGGKIEMKNGKLTGILIDNAMGLVEPPTLKTSVMTEALKEAEQNVFAAGLTTVTDAGLKREQIELLDSLQRKGEIKVRVYAMVADKPELLDYYLDNGPIKTDHLNVRSFKFYLDGALGSRGALMLAPYSDDAGNYGFQLDSVEHYLRAANRLAAADWQMCIHAIGDSANRLALNVYDSALSSQDARWRIEHAQIVEQSDLARFGELGIIPSVQPTHATSDMYWAGERLGANRSDEAYPYHDLLNSVGLLALGTDFPVEEIDPLRTFYSAVFRQDSAGFPEGGFTPKQKLTREQTLRGMTIWAAYAAFEEKEKGSLEAGKWADFVVLDTDLMEAEQPKVLDTRVLMTFLAGEMVYKAEDPRRKKKKKDMH